MRAKKSLGQHFLADSHLLARIADALDAHPGEVVLEVGPGTGTLTRELCARGLRVIAIEKDRRLAAELRAPCAVRGAPEGGDLVVVEGDALHQDWHRLITAHGAPRTAHSFKVIGNIPYNITSPLIEKALTPPYPERIVYLVQAEVADRLAARPGSKAYGALTVGVQALCTVERLFQVKPGAFRPRPKVDSAVVRLVPRPEPLVPPSDVPALRALVTACFSRRRKQLRNVVTGVTGRDRAAVEAGLGELGLDPGTRPETVPPAGFVALLRWSRRL